MKKSILFLLTGVLAAAGTVAQTVQGIVKSAANENLESVNVSIRNTNIYTFTDQNGRFQLNVKQPGKYVLIFNSLGFKQHIDTVDVEALVDLPAVIMHKLDFQTDEVVVTATKDAQLIKNIPLSVGYVSQKEIEEYPVQRIDESLKFLPGINVDRPFGIFGKSVVGVRGIVSNEPGRQLTLIDGVPINKTDGGGVNWNRIITSDVEHIEVLKGPGASIYGNNAMGGIINIVTKRPVKEGVDANVKLNYGTYNTFGGEFNVMQKKSFENKKSIYYSVSGKSTISDGYITVPDSIRTDYDTTVFIKEYAVNARAGYNFSDYTSLEFEYNYYNDNRGQGTKIELPDGATAQYDTHFGKLHYKTVLSGFVVNANMFYQLENYKRDIEKLKRGDYTLINVNSDRQDYGALLSAKKYFGNHHLIFGADFRNGSVYGVDDYQTSTDKVINKGVLNNINIYLQDKISFNKISVIADVNWAFAKSYDGEFKLENPTSATSFMEDYAQKLDSKIWNGFSMRFALQYNFSRYFNVFGSFSQGFRTASLDDLTRTGFISIGYKKANPELTPEKLNNFEIGSRYEYEKFRFSAQTYFSKGNDFMYYVATGESIFGGRKKVYEKRNVSGVEIYGIELSGGYILNKYIKLKLNYTYNNSKITDFPERPDLEGKYLSYTPVNVVNFVGLLTVNQLVASVNFKYKDLFYLDDSNTLPVENIFGLDAKISYKLFKKINLALSVQNILDNRYLVSTDQVSIGRFVMFSVGYKF